MGRWRPPAYSPRSSSGVMTTTSPRNVAQASTGRFDVTTLNSLFYCANAEFTSTTTLPRSVVVETMVNL